MFCLCSLQRTRRSIVRRFPAARLWPGSIRSGTRNYQILKAPGALGSSPYTLFGVISRRDPVTLMRSLIAFTPVAVLKGSEDLNVQSDDVVRVISANEARTLLATVTQYQKHREFAEETLRNPRMSASQNYADTQANTQNGQQRASSTTQMIQSQVQVGSDYNLDARQALELSEQDVLAQAAGQLPVPGLPQAQLRQLYPQTQYQRQYPSAPGSQPPNQVRDHTHSSFRSISRNNISSCSPSHINRPSRSTGTTVSTGPAVRTVFATANSFCRQS